MQMGRFQMKKYNFVVLKIWTYHNAASHVQESGQGWKVSLEYGVITTSRVDSLAQN